MPVLYSQFANTDKNCQEVYNCKNIFWKEVSLMLCKASERGQGLVEYAFILVLVAMIVIAVLLILGPVIGNVFTKLNSDLASY